MTTTRLPKSELVAAVYHRLADSRSWTKGASARTLMGGTTSPSSLYATAWCLTGAMDHELQRRGYKRDHITYRLFDDVTALFQEQYPEIDATTVQGFNDDVRMTHEGIRMILNKVYGKLIERGE